MHPAKHLYRQNNGKGIAEIAFPISFAVVLQPVTTERPAVTTRHKPNYSNSHSARNNNDDNMVDDDFLLPTPKGDHRGNHNERPLFCALCD